MKRLIFALLALSMLLVACAPKSEMAANELGLAD